MNIVLIVVLQLLSYGGFLNLSLGDGGSDSAQCDLLLEVRGCGAGGAGLLLCHCPVVEPLTPPPTHLLSPPQGNGRRLHLSPPAASLARHSLSVAMIESSFLDTASGMGVARDDFLSILAGVTSLQLQLHPHGSAGEAVR